MKSWSLIYQVVKYANKISVWFFYSKIKITGKENIPWNTPIVFAPNHQNAFMDALVLSYATKKQTSFLVRADIFKKKTAAKLLNKLKMMPVYRQRDGMDTIAKNEAIFNMCHEMLEKDNNIIIFPEGRHGHTRTLKQAKKGVSRMTIGAELKHDFNFGVKIVPVGIYYDDRYKFGQKLLINFGQPIDVSKYENQYRENEAKVYSEITNRVKSELSALIIDIQRDEFYITIEDLRTIYTPTLLGRKKSSLKHQFQLDRKLVEKVERFIDYDKEKAEKLKYTVKKYTSGLSDLNFRPWVLNREKYPLSGLVMNFLFLLLSFPIFVYGFVNNIIPFTIPVNFAKKKVKDDAFLTSIHMSMGMILFPLFYLLQGIAFYLFVNMEWWWTIVYWFSLPVTGIYAFNYYKHWKKFTAKTRYNNLIRKKDNRLAELIELRKSIFKVVDNVFK